MVRKNIISVSLVALSCIAVVVACNKDFLEQDTTGLLTEQQAQSKKGADQFLIGSYAALKGIGWEGGGSNWVYGSIVGGEANKGSDAGDQADIVPIQQYVGLPVNNYFNVKWRALYEGIARTNATIRITNNLSASDISDADKKQILAEARFLRGFYHFEAIKMWKNVPFIDETVNVSNARTVSNEDLAGTWTKTLDDLKFAYENLVAKPSARGRINNWGAKAMYAKALMFRNGTGDIAAARGLLTDVIDNGTNSEGTKYNLAPGFHDLFNADRENAAEVRAESVFAYEASVNDGAGGNNANYDQVLNFPYNGGPGGCCGFFQPSFEFVNSFRTKDGLPLLDGSYNTGANQIKNDQGIESTVDFTPDAGPVDPRLDWTVGRRGVPYLDWGPHPGKAWIRDQGNGGPYAPKKNAYYRSQAGKLTDGTNWASGLTAINYKIMRFADVLLLAAECEMNGGSPAKALEYVNRVRTRAAVQVVPGAGVTYDVKPYPAGSFADATFATNAIRMERKLELGMEGHRFFDLVRWGVADVELNKFLTYEKAKLPAAYGTASFTKGKNEVFPIPQPQIDLHTSGGQSYLKQNPNY
ncbi:RagB/SusD family nutrient uptake outer membrane protein [Flavihumibacter rivuli]|uniref:RagB/SusD family nutrient uptake outer membrane protein n=1 Tax=Flavihumibacter rivuli TaxID=2838156 RepID=UPI001BDE673F|nr:RagB/SusD family nutrient uptake outer membrane protein [Flavihumibacter rivuli]ULQ58116.1 RagB/SusD family nutrient uptake outer membrane protein [Flavihumibacter rivuli]